MKLTLQYSRKELVNCQLLKQRRSLKRLSEVSSPNRTSNISTTMLCAFPTNATTMRCVSHQIQPQCVVRRVLCHVPIFSEREGRFNFFVAILCSAYEVKLNILRFFLCALFTKWQVKFVLRAVLVAHKDQNSVSTD